MKPKLLMGLSMIIVVILAFATGIFHEKSQKNDIYSQLRGLSGFDSKVVEGHHFILHFWAKWCAPCAEEMPHLIQFAVEAKEKIPDLKILAVSLDESLEISKTIIPNQGATLPGNFLLLLDSQHVVAEGLGSYQYPETYLYGPQGQVLEKWVGSQKWDTPEVMEYFRQKALPNP